MKRLTALLVLLPLVVAGQDTTLIRPAASVPGAQILAVERGRMVVRTVGFYNWLDAYDVADSIAPRRVDRALPMSGIDMDQFQENEHLGMQGGAALCESILYATMNQAFYHGSVDPYQIIGPLKVVAHVIGTERNLWEIVLRDSLFEAGDTMGGGQDMSRYVLPGSVIVDGNYLIVAAGSWGVKTYDISDRNAPRQVAQIDIEANRAYLWGDRLLLTTNGYPNYFGTYDGPRLCIVDIADPRQPQQVGMLDFRAEPYGNMDFESAKQFLSDYLYVSTKADSGEAAPQMVVFNILDRDSVYEAGRFELPCPAANRRSIHFTIDGGKLYDLHDGILDIFDLTEPLAPTLAGTLRIEGEAYQQEQMIARGDLLFMSENQGAWGSDTAQVLIYNVGPNGVTQPRGRLGLPERLTLGLVYPNPFNGRVVIPFDLPAAGWTKVEIVDASGRKVAGPADGWFPAGSGRYVWDAVGMPAGGYWVKLSAGGRSVTGKAVLLK